MDKNYTKPVYPIRITAELLKVCPATLRIWEKKKLITPKRIGRDRFYSPCDIDRLTYIKDLLQKKHINIAGVKNILDTARCWEVKKCTASERDKCCVYKKYEASK